MEYAGLGTHRSGNCGAAGSAGNKQESRRGDFLMDVFDQMELHKDSLTPAEQAVGRIVKKSPDAILGCTSNELARRYGVSQSAVSRFCKKLGYAGYGDFRMELHKALTLRRFGDQSNQQLDYRACLNQLMEATYESVGAETFRNFYQQMSAATNVYVLGSGQSSIPARMLVGRLMEDTMPAHYVELGYDVETLHCTTNKDEVVIFSSKNDTFRQLLVTASTIEPERRPRITLITNTEKHPLRKLCDQVILLPTWSSLKLPLYLEPQYSMIFFCMLIGSQAAARDGRSESFSSSL
ncbi:MAG: MurR/RpiR family transcriptional regulator [Tractidigestivibacter sp.]|jgi:DNA-binding MurR/RpiR family transcriptional regulator|uniref:MurR/RpiR family transcriptional regulator n=1 Tax=Tractidigestivibacter sp. TaxID=2847320 RepID=UPI003D8A8806